MMASVLVTVTCGLDRTDVLRYIGRCRIKGEDPFFYGGEKQASPPSFSAPASAVDEA